MNFVGVRMAYLHTGERRVKRLREVPETWLMEGVDAFIGRTRDDALEE